jgi:hypothetical protein
MKMTVLYIKDTGHVMAAVTRVASTQWPPVDPADPGPSPEVRALVGDTLPVRSFDDLGSQELKPVALFVPADRLAALTVDLDEAQFASPRLCQVVDGTKVQGPPVRPVAADHTTSGNAGTVVVSLPAPVTGESVPVQIYVPAVGTVTEQSFEGVFNPNNSTKDRISFNLGTALPTGTHQILVLIKGQFATLHAKVVP